MERKFKSKTNEERNEMVSEKETNKNKIKKYHPYNKSHQWEKRTSKKTEQILKTLNQVNYPSMKEFETIL